MKTADELLALGRCNLLELVDYCLTLQEQYSAMAQQLAQNSQSSSKPPSSDGYQKPAPKTERKKSEKKSGGQPGHTGHTLKPVEKPDYTVLHTINWCPCGCGADLSRRPIIRLERRQVFDLPLQKLDVTEHVVEVKVCPQSGKEVHAPWPEGVNAPVQYGVRFLAWLTYLSVQQLLPVERIGQMCADLFGQGVSDATVQAAVHATALSLVPFNEAVVEHIRQSSVSHTDESGVRVNKKLHWLHVVCTKLVTWYGIHAEGCNSFAPSLGMNTVPGDQFRADDVEPVEFLVYPHAGFIGVRDRRLPDVLDDGFVEGNERQSSGVNSGLDGRIAHSLPKEVCAHLANALHRQELLNGEIGKPCEEAHTILHGGVYAFRPWGMHLLSRLWTYLNFDNMLGNVEFLQRQVEDPSSF